MSILPMSSVFNISEASLKPQPKDAVRLAFRVQTTWPLD